MSKLLDIIASFFTVNAEPTAEQIAVAGAWVAWQLGAMEEYQANNTEQANHLLIRETGNYFVYRDDQLTIGMYSPRLTLQFIPRHANIVGYRLVEIVANHRWDDGSIDRMVVFRGFTVDSSNKPDILIRDDNQWVTLVMQLAGKAKNKFNDKTLERSRARTANPNPINRGDNDH